MSNELEPCPFCGASVTLENNQSLKNPDSDTLYWIECSKCMAFDFESYTSANRCISVWNTRPIEDALQSRIAELEQQLESQIELHETWLGTYRIKLDYIDELENKLRRSSLL